jgi:hypothetical protein
MGFAIVVLLLNLGEKDYYEGGALEPLPASEAIVLDPAFPRLLPPDVVHVCSVCGECPHPVEVAATQRSLTLRDHDGWYKLFWAADEVYHFEDPVVLAACLENRTARDPGGTWTLELRPLKSRHGPAAPHECSPLPPGLRLVYELFTSESPIETRTRAVGPYPVTETIQAFSRSYAARHLPPTLSFGWRLVSAAPAPPAPCPCP